MNCLACGTRLETVERQLRAADEATQTVTSCPRCPVKAWKVNTSKTPRSSVGGFRLPISRAKNPNHVITARNQRQRHEINVVLAPENYSGLALDSRHVVVQRGMSRTTSSGSALFPAKALISVCDLRRGECSAPYGSKRLGFNATLTSYTLYGDTVVNTNDPRVLAGHYKCIPEIMGYQAVLYKSREAKTISLVVDLGEVLNSMVLRGIIDSVYSTHALPKVIAPYVDNDFASRLGTLSSRAWDTSKPPESGYTFTCKPDGERSWLVFCGWCWYMVSKQKPHRVKKWQVSEDKLRENMPLIVLDTEYVCGFGFILIDCLTDSHGFPAPTSRSIEWVLETFSEILSVHPSCPVDVRTYFTNFGDACGYTKNVLYPIDGIVAIRNGSTEVLKVKNVKSVELEHRGNGAMYSAEGIEILTTNLMSNIAVGTVAELRFSLDERDGEYRVWDVFPRNDKNGNANGFDAIANIFKSASTTQTSDDDERRRCLLWCNKLREAIFRKCTGAADTRHIILDVGTGTGQSLAAMDKSESVSYILLEPDLKRCKMLQRRLGNVQIVADPPDVIPMIRQLKTRSKKWIIINCSFDDLWRSPRVLTKLAPELKCIQAAFSLQFVADSIHDLFDRYRIPVYGCCYTYDMKDDSGILIDTCGIRMKTINANVAAVKWGSDKVYEEPAISTRDLYGLGSVIRGCDVVDMPGGDENSKCRSVCINVSVLFP